MQETYMRLALELAEKARGRTSPNPMVGAVIIKDGEVVGKGYHQKAGTPHAEVHALLDAGNRAVGATMYVTLEPCSHVGRTPPCSDAVIKAGISQVYVAMEDPNPLVAGQGIRRMENAGIKVHIGLMENEARRLNEIFIKFITTKRPFVLLKWAMTLDGKIAARSGHSKWVTGSQAREMVHRLRDQYDSILVGIDTVITDNPELTCRLPAGGRDPVRIVLDSNARMPIDARVISQESTVPTYVAITGEASQERVKLLQGKVEILKIASDTHGRVGLPELLSKLGEMEISSVLVEGGSTIAAAFLEAKLVDKVMAFVAPKIVGGVQAQGPVGGKGGETMDQAINLTGVNFGQVGEDYFLEGYPSYTDH